MCPPNQLKHQCELWASCQPGWGTEAILFLDRNQEADSPGGGPLMFSENRIKSRCFGCLEDYLLGNAFGVLII